MIYHYNAESKQMRLKIVFTTGTRINLVFTCLHSKRAVVRHKPMLSVYEVYEISRHREVSHYPRRIDRHCNCKTISIPELLKRRGFGAL